MATGTATTDSAGADPGVPALRAARRRSGPRPWSGSRRWSTRCARTSWSGRDRAVRPTRRAWTIWCTSWRARRRVRWRSSGSSPDVDARRRGSEARAVELLDLQLPDVDAVETARVYGHHRLAVRSDAARE